ncbi:MAG TPA: GNAT family N-acetyltransferase [Anaerolineales bacterium]|nr:GNAT family N-acetyltransferase [Anaerolineales bacterium]
MMMFFAPPITWAMAEMADQPAVLALTNSTGRTHTHLDWRPVEDWLGSQPFLLAKRGKRVVGALACPPDPPHTAWVRLFAASTGEAPEKVWNLLWPRTWEMLQSARVKIVAGMSLDPWMKKLYQIAGFTYILDVVVLARSRRPPAPGMTPGPARIRRAHLRDYEAIIAADLAAFAPPWQMSPPVIRTAIAQAEYLTVAEVGGEVVGYQLTTPAQEGGHLARLAVLLHWQGQGIGQALIADLTAYYDQRGARTLTVNTQNTNTASLAVYRRAGFELNGTRFPVLQLTLG